MNLLEKAIDLALHAHAGQTDKGGNPYILHPLSVMMRMSDEKEKIVAVLHDVVEDCGVTASDLRQTGFDTEIIDAVFALTRRENETYMEFVARCAQNKLARGVKIADIQENMDLSRIPNPTETDFKRVEKYKKALEHLQRPQG